MTYVNQILLTSAVQHPTTQAGQNFFVYNERKEKMLMHPKDNTIQATENT